MHETVLSFRSEWVFKLALYSSILFENGVPRGDGGTFLITLVGGRMWKVINLETCLFVAIINGILY